MNETAPGPDEATWTRLRYARPHGLSRGWTRAHTQAALVSVVLFILMLLVPRLVSRDAGLAWTWLFGCAAVAWTFAVPNGVLQRGAAARLRAVRRAHPAEPWLWDNAWDPSGASDSWTRRWFTGSDDSLVGRWCGRLQFVGAAALWIFAHVPAAMAWMLGLELAYRAWRVWCVHGMGTARLSFTRFPYVPGGRATFHFGMSDGGASFRRVAFRLSRVQEVPGERWRRNGFAVSTLRQADDRDPEALLPGPGQDVDVSFDLPASAGGTKLSAKLPAFWVLDVVGETTAGAYAESFLVPIYERPAA